MPAGLPYVSALVLHAIRSGYRYGFQIMAVNRLPSGTVYPALRRLEKAGLIRSQWETLAAAVAEQRPVRKYYEVTAQGESALLQAGERYRFPEIPAPQEAAQ